MRVLVACEYSGVVRDAFIARGHDAVSCDLLPTEKPGPHYQGDVRDILDGMPCGTYRGEDFCDLSSRDKEMANQGIIDEDLQPWDLLIAHPDCTYITSSAEWAYGDGPYHQKVKPETLVGAARRAAREDALDFVRLLLAAPIHMKCIENPARGAINNRIRKPDQIIQPNQFGHDASKATGLWLEGLPHLVPTCIIPPRMVGTLPRWANQTDSGQNKLTPGKDRWKERARTYQGWADAMADQWG